MSRKTVCVFGCDRFDGVYMHRFPHPDRRPELLSTWMSILGERLIEKDLTKIFTNKRVCDYHFRPEHKTSGHRLMFSAVPTLYLDGLHKFMNTSIAIQLEHNYCFPRISAPGESVPHDTIADLESQCMPKELSEIDCTPVKAHMFTWQGLDCVKFDDEVISDNEKEDMHVTPGTMSRDAVELSMYSDDIKDKSIYSDDINSDIKSGDGVHEGYKCNGCSGYIVGFRYVCVQCADYDLCSSCEARGAHGEHYVLRVPGPRPHAEIKSVLDNIRLKLLVQNSVAITETSSLDLVDDLLDDIKIEFVEEACDDISSIPETDMISDLEDPPSSVISCPKVKEKNHKMPKTELKKNHKKPFRRKFVNESKANVINIIDPTDPLHVKEPTKELSNEDHVTESVSKTSHTKPSLYLLKLVKKRKRNKLASKKS